MSYDGFSFQFDRGYAESMLFMSISGSHSYGWSLANSDLDVRMTWFPDIKQALSIFYRGRPKEWKDTIEGDKIVDFTSYPIQNFLGLLEKGNGNCLENLFQHKLVEKKQLVKSLQKLMLKNLHVGFLKHYLGYSQSLMKDLSIESRLQAYGEQKLLLQTYRVLLSGILLAEEKKIVYNLREQLKIISTSHCEEMLNAYLDAKYFCNSELKKEIMEELEELRVQLNNSIQRGVLPTSDHLGLKVQLDNWLRDYYI